MFVHAATPNCMFHLTPNDVDCIHEKKWLICDDNQTLRSWSQLNYVWHNVFQHIHRVRLCIENVCHGQWIASVPQIKFKHIHCCTHVWVSHASTLVFCWNRRQVWQPFMFLVGRIEKDRACGVQHFHAKQPCIGCVCWFQDETIKTKLLMVNFRTIDKHTFWCQH